MSTFTRPGRSKRWIPLFALNDLQLRTVLIHATVGYCFKERAPEEVGCELKYLVEVAKDRVAYHNARLSGLDRVHSDRLVAHLSAVEASGGYMQLISAVAWRAWRMRWPSPDISAEFGIKYLQVMQILERLVRIARILNFPTYEVGNNPGRRASKANEQNVAEKWSQGLTVAQIMETLGADWQVVVTILKRLGLHKRRHPRGYTRDVRPNAACTVEQILELGRQGLPVSQISARLGASRDTVTKHLKRAGLHVPRRANSA
jgi:DNA-binding CsgD family transcriptional regulator